MGEVPHAILVLGPDGLREQEIHRLEAQILGRDRIPWNIHSYHPDTFSFREFLEQAQTHPFLSQRQILKIRKVASFSKTDQETIAQSLEMQTPFTWVILEDEELPAHTILFHQVTKRGRVIRLETPGEDERTSWLKQRLKQGGLDLPKEVIEVMIHRSGENLMALEQAVTKVELLLGRKSKEQVNGLEKESEGKEPGEDEGIPIAEILSLIDESMEVDTFDLVDAISRKDTKKALEIFRLLYERESFSIPEILGVLNWHLKRLWHLKQFSREGLAAGEIMKRLHLPYGVFQRLAVAAQEIDLEAFERILEQLFQLDWSIKQGACEERIALETFLIRMCLPRERLAA